jgi:hypothetical protein
MALHLFSFDAVRFLPLLPKCPNFLQDAVPRKLADGEKVEEVLRSIGVCGQLFECLVSMLDQVHYT